MKLKTGQENTAKQCLEHHFMEQTDLQLVNYTTQLYKVITKSNISEVS